MRQVVFLACLALAGQAVAQVPSSTHDCGAWSQTCESCYTDETCCTLTRGFYSTHYDCLLHPSPNCKQENWPNTTTCCASDDQSIDGDCNPSSTCFTRDTTTYSCQPFDAAFYGVNGRRNVTTTEGAVPVHGGVVDERHYFFLGSDAPIRMVEIFDSFPGNPRCVQLATQYVAATLDICSGACSTLYFDHALESASVMLFGDGLCYSNYLKSGSVDPSKDYTVNGFSVTDLIEILDDYNNGRVAIDADGECCPLYGPEHCGDNDVPTPVVNNVTQCTDFGEANGTCCRGYECLECDCFLCVSTGAKFLGFGVSCDDNPCGSTCPEEPECPNEDRCDGGCTRTQGYWKTHRWTPVTTTKGKGKKKTTTTTSKYTPWKDVCPGSMDTRYHSNPASEHIEDQYFFSDPTQCSGSNQALTLADVLDKDLHALSNKGQACVIAGRQVIAAELNHYCKDSCLTEKVQEALNEANALIDTHCTCADVDGGAGLDSSWAANSTEGMARRYLLLVSEILDGYNNGVYGPGSCDLIEEELDALAENESMVPMGWMIWGIIAIALLSLCCIGGLVVWWWHPKKDEHAYRPVDAHGYARMEPTYDPATIVDSVNEANVQQRAAFRVGQSD